MDGYAVSGDGPWNLVGESRAGHPFPNRVDNGQAVAISTGAHVPNGATGILVKEDALVDDRILRSRGSGTGEKRFIRRAGGDFCDGQTLARTGTAIDERVITLALTAGLDELTVRALPDIGILDCGDELVASPTRSDSQTPATNGTMVNLMARPLTASVTQPAPVADDVDTIADALRAMSDLDVIVTSGGASVGDHDLIQPALQRIGAEVAFWKVAMKPGKPLMVATRGTQIIVGLPGNPVSSYVTAFFVLLPLLRHLAGALDPLPRPFSMECSHDLPGGGSRQEFLRAIVDGNIVTPCTEQGSGNVVPLARANALIERPIGASECKAGTNVPVYLLKNGGIA